MNLHTFDRSTPTCATLTSMTSSTPSLTWMLMWSPLRTLALMKSSCQCSAKESSMELELGLGCTTFTPQEYHQLKKLLIGSTRCLQCLSETFCGSTLTVDSRLASTPRWIQLSRTWLLPQNSSVTSLPSEGCHQSRISAITMVLLLDALRKNNLLFLLLQ